MRPAVSAQARWPVVGKRGACPQSRRPFGIGDRRAMARDTSLARRLLTSLPNHKAPQRRHRRHADERGQSPRQHGKKRRGDEDNMTQNREAEVEMMRMGEVAGVRRHQSCWDSWRAQVEPWARTLASSDS